jgi:RNA polymerase sigma-70 factor (ECF subfamily)
MLQTVLGFDSATIGSAFLVSPAAMSKRLTRAKEKIREAGIPFRLPERDELAGRLAAVLDAIYAAFTADWTEASEALYLSHLLTELLPGEAEALGLLALLFHIEARRPARRNGAGEYVPLSEQDQTLWNHAMIHRAEALLHQAGAMGVVGRYQLEAAIQSAHVHRCRSGVANWPHILRLYDALPATPVVAVNRAIAVAELEGAEAGVAVLDAIQDSRLTEYQPYWAARAELLARAERWEEAEAAYAVAIGLERDPAVRQFLQRRLTSTTARRSEVSGDRR